MERLSLSIRIKLELLFLAITLVLSFLIVLPILNADIEFALLPYNLIYCIVLLTILRYLVLWDYHPFRYSKYGKIALIFIVPISFFLLLEGIHSFVEFRDQIGFDLITSHLSYGESQSYKSYIEKEYLFFSVGSMICAFLLIFKMIRSLWRQYKFDI